MQLLFPLIAYMYKLSIPVFCDNFWNGKEDWKTILYFLSFIESVHIAISSYQNVCFIYLKACSPHRMDWFQNFDLKHFYHLEQYCFLHLKHKHFDILLQLCVCVCVFNCFINLKALFLWNIIMHKNLIILC